VKELNAVGRVIILSLFITSLVKIYFEIVFCLDLIGKKVHAKVVSIVVYVWRIQGSRKI